MLNLIVCQKIVAPLHYCTVKDYTNKSHHFVVLMVVIKNEPKPSLIVIMATRIGYLYNKQTSFKTPKSHPLSKIVAPLDHCTMKKNTNKSHHPLYLQQQEKTNPNLPLL
jgi:hypothetical protein